MRGITASNFSSFAPLATTLITAADEVGPLRKLTNCGAVTQVLPSSSVCGARMRCSGGGSASSGVVNTSSTPVAPRSSCFFTSQETTPIRFVS